MWEEWGLWWGNEEDHKSNYNDDADGSSSGDDKMAMVMIRSELKSAYYSNWFTKQKCKTKNTAKMQTTTPVSCFSLPNWSGKIALEKLKDTLFY